MQTPALNEKGGAKQLTMRLQKQIRGRASRPVQKHHNDDAHVAYLVALQHEQLQMMPRDELVLYGCMAQVGRI